MYLRQLILSMSSTFNIIACHLLVSFIILSIFPRRWMVAFDHIPFVCCDKMNKIRVNTLAIAALLLYVKCPFALSLHQFICWLLTISIRWYTFYVTTSLIIIFWWLLRVRTQNSTRNDHAHIAKCIYISK